jgi:hypothetical protein
MRLPRGRVFRKATRRDVDWRSPEERSVAHHSPPRSRPWRHRRRYGPDGFQFAWRVFRSRELNGQPSFPQLADRILLQTECWRGFRGNETYQMVDIENGQRALVKAVSGAVEELAREKSSMNVATPGGRLQVHWDEEASATALGQLAFFAEFLEVSGLRGDEVAPRILGMRKIIRDDRGGAEHSRNWRRRWSGAVARANCAART